MRNMLRLFSLGWFLARVASDAPSSALFPILCRICFSLLFLKSLLNHGSHPSVNPGRFITETKSEPPSIEGKAEDETISYLGRPLLCCFSLLSFSPTFLWLTYVVHERDVITRADNNSTAFQGPLKVHVRNNASPLFTTMEWQVQREGGRVVLHHHSLVRNAAGRAVV